LLGQRLYNILDDALIDIEMEMSQPFSFNRRGQKYFTSKAYVKVIRKWQHPELTLGQKHLGKMDINQFYLVYHLYRLVH
jgi:hypothetical protein